MPLFLLEILVFQVWVVLKLLLLGKLFLLSEGFVTVLQLCRSIIKLIVISTPNKGLL